MRKKRYKGNTFNLFKVRVLPVLVLFGIFMLLFGVSAFSLNFKDRVIEYNGQSWNFGDKGEKEFKQKWFTQREEISFTVDLQDDYERQKSNNTEMEIPFEVTGKYGNSNIIINNVEAQEGRFIVKATLDTSLTTAEDKVAYFTIDFKENTWGIPKEKKYFSITKDSIPPKVELSVEGKTSKDGKLLFEQDVELTIKVIEKNFDSSKVVVKNVNGEEEVLSPKWDGTTGTVPLTENGEYTIAAEVTDGAGNKGSEELSFAIAKKGERSFIVYKDRRTLDDGATIKPGNLEFEVTNPLKITDASIKVTKNNETTIDVTNKKLSAKSVVWNHNFTEDGVYEALITVSDNYDTHEYSFNFTVDGSGPEIEILGADNNGIYTESHTITVKIDDASDYEIEALTATRKDINGQEQKPYGEFEEQNDQFSQEFQEEGLYTIFVKAKDTLGNESEESLSFIIDSSKPVLEPSLDKEYYSHLETDLKLTLKDYSLDLNQTSATLYIGEDDTTGKTIVISKKDSFTAEATVNLPKEDKLVKEGIYKIVWNSTDGAKNIAGGEIIFTVDNTDPVLSIKTDGEEIVGGEKFAEGKKVKVSVSDANFDESKTSLTVKKYNKKLEKIGDEDFILNENGLDVSFEDTGLYELTLQSEDKAGNKAGPLTVKFKIDKDAPVFQISNLTDGAYYSSVNAIFTVKDFTLNMGKTSLTYQNLDNPDQFIGEIPLTQVRFWKAKAEALFGPICEKNDQDDPGEEGSSKKLICGEGKYLITFSSQDDAGNGILTNTLNFTLDYTAPTITLNGIEDKAHTPSGELEIGIDDNFKLDTVIVEVEKDGEPLKREEFTRTDEKELSSPWSYTLSYNMDEEKMDDGHYKVKVTSIDKAKNKSEEEISFVIDSKSPKVKIDGVEDSTYYIGDKKATIIVTERNYNSGNISEYVDVTVTKNGKEVQLDKDIKWTKGENDRWTLDLKFAEDAAYTINVTAKDEAGNKPASEQVAFTIDTVKPKLSIDGVENGHNYKSKEATITVTDTNIDLDNTTLTITKGGVAYNAGQLEMVEGSTTKAQLTYNFKEEGVYRIELKSTDLAKQTTELEEEVVFIIDSTAPVVEILGIKNGSYNPKDMLVTLAVTEHNYTSNKVDIKVTRNGENYPDYPVENWKNIGKESKLRYNFKEDGHYNIAITATDKAGNGPVTKTVTFTVDKTKPAIEISGVNNSEHYNVNKTVTIGITDKNLDINKVNVTRNGSSYNAGSFSSSGNSATLVHTFTAEGEYNIFVEAIDKAGNNFTKEMNFKIDKTAPVITPYVGGENHVIKDGEYINKMFTPNFSLDVKDDRIVSVLLNGNDVTGKVPAITVDGKYDFKVVARDKAGNESEIAFGFTLDVTMPKLDISGVVDGYFNKDVAPVVTYSDKNLDKEKTSVTLNGQPYKSGTKLQYEQDYVLKANIVDLAGNVTARSIVFTIDKTAPSIKFTEPISEQYFNNSIIPGLIVEDMSNYDIISMTLDGESYEIGQEIDVEGKHVLYFEVKDAAGNIKQLSVEFIIDTTPPKVVYEGVKKNETYYDPVYVKISLDNPLDRIQQVTVNGELFDGEVTEKDGKKYVKVSATKLGEHEIKVLAVDEAGNESEVTIPFQISEKSLLMKVYENKPLFAGSVAGGVALLGAAGTLGYRRIRKNSIKKDIENDYYN